MSKPKNNKNRAPNRAQDRAQKGQKGYIEKITPPVKDVAEVVDKLTKLAKGEEEPSFKGQDRYIKLFFDLIGVAKKTKIEREDKVKIEFSDPETMKELITTLVKLKAIPKPDDLDVIDAEVIEVNED